MAHHDFPRTGARVPRRGFLVGGGAAAAAFALADRAAADDPPASLAASPPAGFTPKSYPGKVVRVAKSGVMQPNGLWPTDVAAARMLERAMTEFTGKKTLGEAFAEFVHKDDKVAIKPNGIAGQKGATMASNKELVVAIVRGLVEAGVPPTNIHLYEQYPSFLAGTRVATRAAVVDPAFPAGVTASVHENGNATMPEINVGGVATKFVRAFTDATAVINVGLIKDHGICGYTGCLKNITHGSSINPHAFHEHNASPQIAQLYAQSVVRSRVRLHITDAFKLIYDQGPLDKNPARRVLHESVYVATDPVAMDVLGWQVVEKHRKENALPTLKAAGREPTYIRVAGDLGLGVADTNAITLRDVAL